MSDDGRDGRRREAPALRVKFGLNPYCNRNVCAHCRAEFEREGLWLRLELAGTVVDMPLCPRCLAAGNLYETVVRFEAHHRSHPLGLA